MRFIEILRRRQETDGQRRPQTDINITITAIGETVRWRRAGYGAG
jgi:hypothetical protein